MRDALDGVNALIFLHKMPTKGECTMFVKMGKRKIRIILASVLIVSAAIVTAWIAYNELTRPSTPVIAIEDGTVSWVATGTGDMEAGRFIRWYEARVVVGNETLTLNVDGPTEIGEIMTIDLTTLDLVDTGMLETNAEISVRTIRTLNTGARTGRWSNMVIWVHE